MKSPYRYMMILFTLGAIGLQSGQLCAQPAPVYDADSMYEPMGEQDLPPPPPPEQDGIFVPMQRESSAAPSRDNQAAPRSMSPDQRLRIVEQQLQNLQNNEGNARLESLQTQIQSLRGQIEELSHQLEQVEAQQKKISGEIEHKLSGMNSKGSSVAPKTLDDVRADTKLLQKPSQVNSESTKTGSSQPQPNIAEEQQIYQTAYNLIKEKKFSEAANTLQGMLKKYPSGQFASNAHYWLGELYGVMGKNTQALTEFNTVVKEFSESSRVADAQLKLGLIYSTQAKWSDAKNAFKKVVSQYPSSTSARLAKEQLKELKKAGH